MNQPQFDADKARRLRRIARVARLLDTAIRLPGGFRIGADALVGILPVAGDSVAAGVSLWIVNEARRLGLPGHKLARMIGNIGFDFAFGSVPLVGTVFDAVFKANRRNLNIILDHFGFEETTTISDIDDRAFDDLQTRRMKDVTPRSSAGRGG